MTTSPSMQRAALAHCVHCLEELVARGAPEASTRLVLDRSKDLLRQVGMRKFSARLFEWGDTVPGLDAIASLTDALREVVDLETALDATAPMTAPSTTWSAATPSFGRAIIQPLHLRL